MSFLANFTAIDFETASRRRDSACQLAAVRVRDGRIVNEAMWMIKPRPMQFSRGNIYVHGITPDRVVGEPEFGELWDAISETLGDDCLIAHNASFDMGVLVACLQTHRKAIPEMQFSCTRAVARRTWPHRRGFGLKPLSDWLGVRFKHHDALEDSIACAKIMLAAGIDQEASSLEDLEKRLKLTRGKVGDWGYRGPTTSRKSRRPRTVSSNATPPATSYAGQATARKTPETPIVDLQRLMIRAEFIQPLRGKCVVFSGDLSLVNLQEAESLACKLGGTCQAQVNEQTDFLVVGKATHAEAVKESNTSAEVLGEQAFLELIVRS
jgi:DNA polymerase-3 subunit epsilon